MFSKILTFIIVLISIDGNCNFYVEKSPDFKKHYVYTDKNRYQNRNLEELQYNIYFGKLNPIASEQANIEIEY